MNFLKTSQCQSTYNFSMTSQCQITYNTHESFDDCIIYIINVMLIILIVYLFSNVNISDKQLRCLKCSLGYELAWLVRDQSSWKALIISREDFNIAAPILFRPFRPRIQDHAKLFGSVVGQKLKTRWRGENNPVYNYLL